MASDIIPYGSHSLDQDDINSVLEVLSSEYLTQGSKVPDFEDQLANYTDSLYAVCVNSATSALHISCLALDVSAGDLVWSSSTSFVASSNCALYCGADIDFVDIDYSTGLMCLDLLEEKLVSASSKNLLPKVIIVVNFSGSTVDYLRLKALKDRFGFLIIEDASHALGASCHSHKVGSCFASDITVFSFHPVKMITTAEGGCCTTNDAGLYKRLSLLRSHGIEKTSSNLLFESPGPWYYEQHYLGYNYRMPDVLAALGISQLRKLDQYIATRHKIFEFYQNLLSDTVYELLKIPQACHSSLHLAVLRIPSRSSKQYLNFFNYMRSKNIFIQLHYLPIHLQPYYQNLGFKPNQFPNSELHAITSVSIPIYPTLSNSKLSYVVDTLLNYSFV